MRILILIAALTAAACTGPAPVHNLTQDQVRAAMEGAR